MICCASPAGVYTENTRKTLEFGQSVRRISIRPKINVTSKSSNSKLSPPVVGHEKADIQNSRPNSKQSIRSSKGHSKFQNLPSTEKNRQQLQDEYISMPDMNKSISELEDQKMLAIERQWQSLQNNYDAANQFKAKVPEFNKTIHEKEKNIQRSTIPSKSVDIPALMQDEDVYSVSSDSEVSDLCSEEGRDAPHFREEKQLNEKGNTSVDEETYHTNVIEDQAFKVGENRDENTGQESVIAASNEDDFDQEDGEVEFFLEEQDDVSRDSFMTEDIRFRPMSAIYEDDITEDSIEGSKDSRKFVESESKSMDKRRMSFIPRRHNDTKSKKSTDTHLDRSSNASTVESEQDIHISVQTQHNTFKNEINEETRSETQNVSKEKSISSISTNPNIDHKEKSNHANSDRCDSSKLQSQVEDMDQKSWSTNDSNSSKDAASAANSTEISVAKHNFSDNTKNILEDHKVVLSKEQNNKNSVHTFSTPVDDVVKHDSNDKQEASSPTENERPSDGSIVVSIDNTNDIPFTKDFSDSERLITKDVTISRNMVAETRVDSSNNERKNDCAVSIDSFDQSITKTGILNNNDEISKKDDSLSHAYEPLREENQEDLNDSTDTLNFPKNVTQEHHGSFDEEDSIDGEIHQENINDMNKDGPCNETEDEQRGIKAVVEIMLSYSEESDGQPKGDDFVPQSSSNEERILAEEMVDIASEEKDLPPDETMKSSVIDEATRKSSDQDEPRQVISVSEKIEEVSPNDWALESTADTISDIESISFATSHLENEVMKLKEENIVLMKMITMVRENNHKDFYESDNGLSDISHDSGLFMESTERSINEDRNDHDYFNESTESDKFSISGRKVPELLLKTQEYESSTYDDVEQNNLIQSSGSNQKQAHPTNTLGDVICNTGEEDRVGGNNEFIAQASISAQSHLMSGEGPNLKRNLQKSIINFEAKMQRTMKQEETILQRWEDLSGDFRSYRLRWASSLNRRSSAV